MRLKTRNDRHKGVSQIGRSFFQAILCFCLLSACVNNSASKQDIQSKSGSNEHILTNLGSSINVYSEGDCKYIIIDTVKFKIPVGVDITPTNIYNGIYQLKSDSLVRHNRLVINGLSFLTTFEDLGRGVRANLYAFDMERKAIIADSSFQRDYLTSSAGIFVIDTNNNRIFSVGKMEWLDSKQEAILPASIYKVTRGYYEFVKNVYMVGNEVPGDTALLKFYKNSISPDSKSVFPLPEDWWKAK